MSKLYAFELSFNIDNRLLEQALFRTLDGAKAMLEEELEFLIDITIGEDETETEVPTVTYFEKYPNSYSCLVSDKLVAVIQRVDIRD